MVLQGRALVTAKGLLALLRILRYYLLTTEHTRGWSMSRGRPLPGTRESSEPGREPASATHANYFSFDFGARRCYYTIHLYEEKRL